MKLPITLILIFSLLLWLGIQKTNKNRECPEGSYWTGYVCYSPEVGGGWIEGMEAIR